MPILPNSALFMKFVLLCNIFPALKIQLCARHVQGAFEITWIDSIYQLVSETELIMIGHLTFLNMFFQLNDYACWFTRLPKKV